jgi:hypothetical protein
MDIDSVSIRLGWSDYLTADQRKLCQKHVEALEQRCKFLTE